MVRHPLPLGAPGRQTITYGSDSPLRSAASSERAERIVISSVPAAEPGPNAEAGPEAGPAPGPEPAPGEAGRPEPGPGEAGPEPGPGRGTR